MLTAQVPDRNFMDAAIVGAERAGYLGMVIVAAREADNPRLLQELVTYWSSLDDVTGNALAVLCPLPSMNPRLRDSPRDLPNFPGAGAVEDGATSTSVTGRTMGVLGGPARGYFSSEFMKRLREKFPDKNWDSKSPSLAGHQPNRLLKQREHRDAWTGSARTAADYLGLDESQIPSIILLSYVEKTAVVVPAVPGLSLYDVLKRVARACSNQYVDLRRCQELADAARTQWHESQQHVDQVRNRVDKHARRIFRLIEQITVGLDADRRHVQLTEPAKEGLHALLRGEPCDLDGLRASLHAIHTQRIQSGFDHSTIAGLLKALDEAGIIEALAEVKQTNSKQIEGSLELQNHQQAVKALAAQLEGAKKAVRLADRFKVSVKNLGLGLDVVACRFGSAGLESWTMETMAVADNGGTQTNRTLRGY